MLAYNYYLYYDTTWARPIDLRYFLRVESILF